MFGSGGFANLTRDQLYGAVIRITQVQVNADGSHKGDMFTYYTYRWVSAVHADDALDKAGNTAAFHRTFADGKNGFVREKQVDFHLPDSVSTTLVGTKPDSPYRLDTGHLPWTFDPPEVGFSIETFKIEANDLLDGTDTKTDVGQIVARGRATAPTTISIDEAGFKSEFKRVISSLQSAVGPGPDKRLGVAFVDDDRDGVTDNPTEAYFAGSDDTLEVVYDFANTESLLLGGVVSSMMVGLDRKPGQAGIDDDGNQTIDDAAEFGFGDDQIGFAIVNAKTVMIASSRFKSVFAELMPGIGYTEAILERAQRLRPTQSGRRSPRISAASWQTRTWW